MENKLTPLISGNCNLLSSILQMSNENGSIKTKSCKKIKNKESLQLYK